jgi:hypothetical protein
MTTTTETTKEKQVPAFYIFATVAHGSQEELVRIGAAFPHKVGNGLNVLINGKRYVAFPPKAKTAEASDQPAATEGDGA